MSKLVSPKLPPQILDEASAWFVEFSEGDVSLSARREFIHWLRTSPEHVRAYLQISAHWEDAKSLARSSDRHSVDELVAIACADSNVVALSANGGAAQLGLQRVEKRGEESAAPGQATVDTEASPRSRRLSAVYALAASVLLLVLSGWLYSQRNVYVAEIGEQRFIKLADGSSVDLNSRSKIRVQFSRGRRDIELLQGQALFRVAKDFARPFVVHSGRTDVRAVGTQFDVNVKAGGTTVTVVEGRVAIVPPDSAQNQRPMTLSPSAGTEILLAAGEQLTVTREALERPAHIDVAATTAWTQKRLVFKSTPLAEVVEEFNRYNVRQMVITDSSIEAVRFSGVFSSTDPASLLRGLDALGAFSVHETRERIEISPK